MKKICSFVFWVAFLLCTPALALEIPFDLGQSTAQGTGVSAVSTSGALAAAFTPSNPNSYWTKNNAQLVLGTSPTRLLSGTVQFTSTQPVGQPGYTPVRDLRFDYLLNNISFLQVAIEFTDGKFAALELSGSGTLSLKSALLAEYGTTADFSSQMISSVSFSKAKATQGANFTLSQLKAYTSSPNDPPPHAPIPGAALLLGTGIVGLIGLQRKGRKA